MAKAYGHDGVPKITLIGGQMNTGFLLVKESGAILVDDRNGNKVFLGPGEYKSEQGVMYFTNDGDFVAGDVVISGEVADS